MSSETAPPSDSFLSSFFRKTLTLTRKLWAADDGRLGRSSSRGVSGSPGFEVFWILVVFGGLPPSPDSLSDWSLLFVVIFKVFLKPFEHFGFFGRKKQDGVSIYILKYFFDTSYSLRRF